MIATINAAEGLNGDGTMETINRKLFTEQMLRKIPFFADLTELELLDVEAHITMKRIGKNEVVLFEEDTVNFIYFVYSGKVRVVQTSEQGRERILKIHKKNEYFGEMAILDGKTSPATVIAMEDSEIGLLGRDDFNRIRANNDRICQQTIAVLCRRLREAWMTIRTMSFATAEEKIMAALDQLKRANGVRDQRGVIITMRLTHSQIASYASVSRETVTRTLNKLVKEGSIEILDNKSILVKKDFTI